MSTSPRYRAMQFGVTEAELRTTADGTNYIKARLKLQDYPRRMTDRLLHWAQHAPERSFMARRARKADGSTGDWVHLSYAQALDAARSIGQALLDRKLSADRPVLILSENDLEHAQIALGCLYAGIPWAPASPAYSLVSQDFDKLRHLVDTLTPGLVYAAEAPRYERALLATLDTDVEIVTGNGSVLGRATTSFAALRATVPTSEVDEAMEATGPDTITKFLFTSGSTKLPKAVINTQGMWCANQQQMAQSIPILADPDIPPVLVDWLPWNHTFGGNHNFGMVLFHGGTLYIDDGKPTPTLIGETLRNLREIAPTIYFNVPTGFEAIANAMNADEVLRRNLLSRVRMFFYAGAALAQPVWETLHSVQEKEIGERIVMGTGLGMTESGPFGIFVTRPEVKSGDLGLPAPGLELKLVPNGDKVEVRYRGPNITPGYWRGAKMTAEAFDNEGFFCTGDAVTWIDPNNPNLGLRFDGRIAEDFKLATGTFVSVGPLRAKIIAAGAPFVLDAAITGLNEKEVGAMLFTTGAVRSLAGTPTDANLAEVLAHPAVLSHFQDVLDGLVAQSTGSANRVARMILLAEPPSIEKGEVTDKGSINQRAVLKHRETMVAALHAGTVPNILLPRSLN